MALRIGRCRIPEHLKKVKMTQVEYANRIRVSESFASKIMTCEKKLSLVRSKMSADLFGCHIDDLYTWEYFSEKGER